MILEQLQRVCDLLSMLAVVFKDKQWQTASTAMTSMTAAASTPPTTGYEQRSANQYHLRLLTASKQMTVMAQNDQLNQ